MISIFPDSTIRYQAGFPRSGRSLTFNTLLRGPTPGASSVGIVATCYALFVSIEMSKTTQSYSPISCAANDCPDRLSCDSRRGASNAPPSEALRYRYVGNAANSVSTGFTRLANFFSNGKRRGTLGTYVLDPVSLMKALTSVVCPLLPDAPRTVISIAAMACRVTSDTMSTYEGDILAASLMIFSSNATALSCAAG